MNQFETDEQRAEALVAWLKAKGAVVVVGIVLGFSAIAGLHYYKSHKVIQRQESAAMYSKFIKQLDNPDQNNIDHLYETILEQKNDIYKGLAGLLVAHQLLESGNTAKAKEVLEQTIANEKNDVFLSILNFRLAKIYYDEGELDRALSQLKQVTVASYKSIAKDLEGDIWVKKNDIAAARIAYEEAILAQGASQLTHIKFEHLGGMKQ